MDLAILSTPPVTTVLWLILAAAVALAWARVRARPIPRRYGGALACVVVAIVIEAVLPWLPASATGIAYALALAALSFAAVRGLAVTVDLWARRRQVQVSTIFRDLATLLVYGVVILAVLHSLDVDISALLTTSAIVTAVIGLALQETLGNVFSGLSLQIQKPFEPGDWVRFGTFLGRVQGIGWRSTSFVTRDLQRLEVPNAVLAREVLINHRGAAIGDEIIVRVAYATPPNVAKAVILSVLGQVPDVVAMPPAVVELDDYGETGIKYRIHFWMADFSRQERVRDAITTRLWYAFRRHGIEVPPPISHVHLRSADTAAAAESREWAAALRAVDFLAELDDAELDMLRASVVEAVYGHDEIICREGEPGETFFVLRRGTVSVVARDAGGRDTHVVDIRAPGFFGEMALLTGEPRVATVRAKGDVEVLVVDRSGFEVLFQTHPSVAAEISRILAARQSELRERREQSVVPESPESRSRNLLARMQAIFRF